MNESLASNTLAQLQSSLEHELNLVQQFLTALQKEAHVLTLPNDNDALDASTEQKNQFAEQLTQAEKIRADLLKELGYKTNKAGLLAVAADHPALHAVCENLLLATQQANELNTTNGAIISAYLEHNQQAIDTLRAIISRGNLYDATGRTKSLPASNKKGIKAG